jgi:tRNA(Arg) A34 adenosine deaminase TadA
MLKNQNDYSYLLKCLELAQSSVDNGNHPFGALILYKNTIVETSANDVITSGDVTGHAELNLVRKIQKKLTAKEREKCTLYTSTEPCAMCAGAIYWTGIRTVVYGCSTKQLNHIVGGCLGVELKDVFEKGQHDYEIRELSNYDIFQSIHKSFW